MIDVALTDRRAAVATRTSLPPAGPVWFSAVMGTALLATLLGRAPALLVPAAALLALAVVLLLGLSGAFLTRVARDRAVFTATLRDAAVLPTWGTVAMGVLAVGSAVLTIAPRLGVGTAWAVGLDAVLWTVGTVLGVVTAFGFAAVLVRRDLGHPVPAWGLAMVPPMVSATTGAALLPHVSAQLALLVVVLACFFLALFLGVLIFAITYRHHWRVAPLPIAASTSAWIPLGMVGQSAAAAQVMATHGGALLAAPAAAHTLADAYGYAMLAVSVPVVAYAVRMTVRGFRARMPFSPGWWALTFPIGTLALGSLLLGQATDDAVISAVGVAAVVTMTGTWTLCAVATVRAVFRRS